MAYVITKEVQGEEDSKEILFVVEDEKNVSNIPHELRKMAEKSYHNSDRFIFSKEYATLYEDVNTAMTEVSHYV